MKKVLVYMAHGLSWNACRQEMKKLITASWVKRQPSTVRATESVWDAAVHYMAASQWKAFRDILPIRTDAGIPFTWLRPSFRLSAKGSGMREMLSFPPL